MRRTRSGINTPIHVVKKTGSSDDQSKCELNSCIEVSQATARGNQPAYECEHLRSVQNADPYVPQEPLQDDVLETMISEFKWLKKSRKAESVHVRDQATAEGICPVYPWMPKEGESKRYRHFSVVSGTKVSHYWCRFRRAVVTFDTMNGIWKCACSPSKRGCLHKVLAKWYTLQHLPEQLASLPLAAADSADEMMKWKLKN